jgi:TolB-like protein/Flp pilus assembly protein TadD
LRYQHASEVRADLKRLQRQLASAATVAAAAEPTASPRNKRLWAAAAIACVVVLVVVTSIFSWRKRSSRGSSLPPRAMLAVLPFDNLSGDAHDDYVADGLTEEMIAQLGQLQPARLGVIARTSIVRYKGTKETAAQIGRELGVGYLLVGSVRHGGQRLRVTAALIQANEQSHLWAETYDRSMTDLLTIQSEIGERITHSLSIRLLPGQKNPSQAAPRNFESYDKYLLGLHELANGTRESETKAIQYFQEGLAIDPKDARLHAALAEGYAAMETWYTSPMDVMPRAKEEAQRALELDPDLASAHALLGQVHLLFDWDWPAAEKEIRQALDLNPTLADAQLSYGTYLVTLGRFDEAVSRVRQAFLFDPLAPGTLTDALWIYFYSGRLPETAQQAQKIIELAPDAALPHAMLALAYAHMGKSSEAIQSARNAVRLPASPSVLTVAAGALAHAGQSAEAKRVLAKALDLAKERYVCRFLVAGTYMEFGDKQKALESLEQGILQRST